MLVGSLTGLGAFLAVLALVPSFGAALAVASLAGLADGPALAATLTVRQGHGPAGALHPGAGHRLQLQAQPRSSAGSATAGLLTALLTPRELLLGLAAGQLLAASPVLLLAYFAHLGASESVLGPSPAPPAGPGVGTSNQDTV